MEASRLWNWADSTCVIAASGPSLTDEQIQVVQSSTAKLITVNSTWQKAPWAHAFYACDMLWWRHNFDKIAKIKAQARCWTQDRGAAERYHINYVRQESLPGLGLKGLRVNGNSGAGAINLAVLFGCKRIVLMGFDMKFGPHGKLHWHPDHPPPMVQHLDFNGWVHKFDLLAREIKAAGVSVFNATPGSALKCFKEVDLREVLA